MNDWKFTPKLYPHFDHMIYNKQEAFALVQSPAIVAQHTFYPFLEYKVAHRKLTKSIQKHEAAIREQDTSGIIVRKARPIKYACHKDAIVYSYYRHMLAQLYEKRLQELNISQNVIAYRKIPIADQSDAGKCNIHFAKEAFDEIIARGTCIAITLDIKGFFESLNHDFLHQKWCELLNLECLPKDHEHIFKNITQYSYVDLDQCYESLGFIDIKNRKRTYKICPYKLAEQKKKLCSNNEYRERIVKLVQKNNYQQKTIPQGIPQGSPISDILANLYMIDFDVKMQELACHYNGYYRRYSDDILWICSPENAKIIEDTTKEVMLQQGQSTLKIHDDKTTHTRFTRQTDGQLHYENISEDETKTQKMFSYLGFSFNGQKAFFRESTLSRYKRDVTFSVRSFVKRAADAAEKNGGKLLNNLNVSMIYHKNSYLNKEYIEDQREENLANGAQWKRTEGNFRTYEIRAKKVFNCAGSLYPLSDSQLKKHKKFVTETIIQEARKFEPTFSLKAQHPNT